MDWELFKTLAMRGESYSVSLVAEWPQNETSIADENIARALLARKLLISEKNGNQRMPADFMPDVAIDDGILWTEIPILLQADSRAKIYYILLGLLPIPEIRIESGEWLSAETRETVKNVLLASADNGTGFALIRRGAPPRGGITGNSLALPLGVGAHLLMEKKRFPEWIAMTGALDANGRVKSVDYIDNKHVAARKNKLLFVYPFANKQESLPLEHSFPVTTIKAAIALCEGIESTRELETLLPLLAAWRDDPASFFSWLASRAPDQNLLHSLLDIAEAEKWKDNFQNAALAAAVQDLYKWRGKHGNSEAIERLLDFFDVDKIIHMENLPLLLLAKMKVTQLNHKGIVNSPWHDICREHIPLVERESLEANLEALGAEVPVNINQMLNVYNFNAPLETAWRKRLAAYEKNCETLQLSSDGILGKIYGALTQVAAFSGNPSLAIQNAEKSLRFFSRDEDKYRRWLDLAYIYCDQSETRLAASFLNLAINFQAKNKTELFGKSAGQIDDKYFHAAYSRLCLLDNFFLEDYPAWEIFHKLAAKAYPWNCWANNIGRLLINTNPSFAKECFEFAVELCLENENAVTLKPMALLPLAARARMSANSPWLKRGAETFELLRELCVSGRLCGGHFKELLAAKNLSSALEFVEKNQKTLFPFNYR